jgi:mannose-1-phosphate guanylyltransferase
MPAPPHPAEEHAMPPITRRTAALLLAATAVTSAARAQDSGLVTVPSAHGVRATLDRFGQAVRAATQ